MTRAEYRMMGERFHGDGWETAEVDYFAGPLHEEHLNGLRSTRDGMNAIMVGRMLPPEVGMFRRVWIEKQEWNPVDPEDVDEDATTVIERADIDAALAAEPQEADQDDDEPEPDAETVPAQPRPARGARGRFASKQ
jgi:hypothetical protein